MNEGATVARQATQDIFAWLLSLPQTISVATRGRRPQLPKD